MIHVGDNSWILRVYITDLQIEKNIRVKGELHVGGVMLKLADYDSPKDWSDHALWWPAKNTWLTRTKSTLDQVGVNADSYLHFTPMHKMLRIQMPDLRYINCSVDFSITTFSSVVNLCKSLGVSHPEELSFCRPLEPIHLKQNYVDLQKKKLIYNNDANGEHERSKTPTGFYAKGSNGSLDGPYFDRSGHEITLPTAKLNGSSNGSYRNEEFLEDLTNSPRFPSPEAKSKLLQPKSLLERARMNVNWLDSSLSLMEQGVREFDNLLLRFKYYAFFDLNPKIDQVRINQLYEQAKWQILNEEIDCTEEESLMFAALQFQVNLQNSFGGGIDTTQPFDEADDIDAALSELEISLKGQATDAESNITNIPELKDYLKLFKPKKFTLKQYKRYYVVYRDLRLFLYKSRDEYDAKFGPVADVNLRGCEVTPDVNLSANKFAIKLEVPGDSASATNQEIWIRCEGEDQYVKWMAACRLASKGRSLADSAYNTEISNIKQFLLLQKPVQPANVPVDESNIDPNEYFSRRLIKKLKNRAVYRMLEAHGNVKHLSNVDAKLNYLKAWQSLPEFGVSLFIIKMHGQKKEELLGIANNRIMRIDINTGDHLKIWRYSNMKAWNVNWEIKCMMVQFADESIIFSCLSGDCKIIHEFIGGYIFMSMRSKDSNQVLNEELFHKLTSGWA